MMDDQEMPDDKTLGGIGKRDLVFTRVFDASIERVWKAWTNPEQVKRWWGARWLKLAVFPDPLSRG